MSKLLLINIEWNLIQLQNIYQDSEDKVEELIIMKSKIKENVF